MRSENLEPRATLLDADAFALVVGLEVRQAVRLQYYVSLLTIVADPEGPGLDIDLRTLYQLIADVIRGEIRSTDVVSVSTYLHVLLVASHLHDLPVIIGRIVSAVNGRVFEVDGKSCRVTLSMGGACFPTTAHERDELFRQADALSVEVRRESGTSGHRYRLAGIMS